MTTVPPSCEPLTSAGRASRIKALAVVGAVLMLVAGCRGGPQVIGTQTPTQVLISESLKNADVAVQPGHEVQWINATLRNVQVLFLTPLSGRLSCNRGFGSFMEPVESAVLTPGESASACVQEPGVFRYAIRLNIGGGPDGRHVAGLLHVGEPSDPALIKNNRAASSNGAPGYIAAQ
jgi:plastocyanin